MYNDEEMNAINKTLGQGFVLRLSDYIMNKRKTAILVKHVSDGYVVITLRYKCSKHGGYIPVAYVEHYVVTENGTNTTHGVTLEIGSECPTQDFEVIKAKTFLVDVDYLINIGENIEVKH